MQGPLFVLDTAIIDGPEMPITPNAGIPLPLQNDLQRPVSPAQWAMDEESHGDPAGPLPQIVSY